MDSKKTQASEDDRFQETVAGPLGYLGLLKLDETINEMQPSGPATVYTSLTTIWLLIIQRLYGGISLSDAVKVVLSKDSGILPDNKRVREETLSANSGAYSAARKRLALKTVEYFSERVADSIVGASEPWFGGRRAFIIDGTTLTLPPTSELTRAFPPAQNQYGTSVWPCALLFVAHELQSGAAVAPEVGPMYGEAATSEAQLARRTFQRLPSDSIVFADAGLGIFSVAYQAVAEGHQILFRMTKTRFRAKLRNATPIDRSKGWETYRLTWKPTPKDRKTNPDLPADASLEVHMHVVRIGELTLYLITTLPIDAEQAAAWYRRRYDIENDIRDIKNTLNIEKLRAKGLEMFHKELLTSLVAYNLTIQFRRQAAELASLNSRRLSFKRVWNVFQRFLLEFRPANPGEWLPRYDRALRIASGEKIPNRPGRSYPRRAHPRRQKSTKFMKQQAREKAQNTKGPPEDPTK